MRIELLWSPGCPNWRKTDAAQVPRLPDRLIDGTDPFAQESDPVGLSCPGFRTPDGLRGAPTVEQLLSALRGAT